MSRRRTLWYAAQSIVIIGEARAEKDRFLFDNSQDVVFPHHQEIIAINLDFRAGIFAEQHYVANLDIQRKNLAVFGLLAVTNSHDLAALRLFFCGFGDKKPPGGLGLFLLS